MVWIVLFVAGLFEVGWAVGLKYTEGLAPLALGWDSRFDDCQPWAAGAGITGITDRGCLRDLDWHWNGRHGASWHHAISRSRRSYPPRLYFSLACWNRPSCPEADLHQHAEFGEAEQEADVS